MESKKQDRIKTELIDMEYREEIGGSQRVGRGSEEWLLDEWGASFWGDKVLELNRGDGCPTLWMY